MTGSSVLRRLRLALLPVPGQAVGLAFLVAVLTAALVSAPLFTASAEAGAWDRERERVGEGPLGASLRMTTASRRGEVVPARIGAVDDLDAGVREAAGSVGLGTPVLSAAFRNPLAGTVAARSDAVVLVGLPDLAGVDIVAGGPSDEGVLVPEPLADRAALGPGTTLTLTGANGTVVLPVSGVYVPPVAPSNPSWDGLRSLVRPTVDPATGRPEPLPSLVVAPQALALDTAETLVEDLDLVWSLPLAESVGISGARAAAERFEALQATLLDPEGPVAGIADADVGSAIVRTGLPGAFEAVTDTTELLAPPVRAVGTGGAGAALVLVGAWAAHRVRRREDELRLLVARGLSPLRSAGDAAREGALPAVTGVLAGALLGWLLVRVLGPSARLPSGAVGGAVTAALLGLAAVLLVVAVVTALLVARLYQAGSGPADRLLGRVPWLAVVTAVTAVAVAPLLTGDRGPGGRVGLLVLVAPLLVTVVAAGAVTAVLPRLGRRADARLRRLPPGPYLALRRVLAARGTARLVVVTTALSLALVVQAGALATSTARTLAAKTAVATGSDVVVSVPRGQVVDEAALGQDAMLVGRMAGVIAGPDTTPIDVFAVRPERVAGVVRWDEALAESPLEELMAALADYDGDRVPVVLAGGPPGGVPLTRRPVAGGPRDGTPEGANEEFSVAGGFVDVGVEVVARADAFPGQPSRRPVLIADRDRFVAALERVGGRTSLVLGEELWSRGDADAVVEGLPALGIVLPDGDAVTTAAAFADRPELAAQVWSLDYLRVVALAAGALGLAGLAVHATAQQRRRAAATLLLTRMGLDRRASDVAAGLETGLLAAGAALVAVTVALPASALAFQRLDPVPALLPDVLFRVPWGSIATVLAGVVLVPIGSAVLAGRSGRRTNGGQVVRDAS